jgi:hypothetical protein
LAVARFRAVTAQQVKRLRYNPLGTACTFAAADALHPFRGVLNTHYREVHSACYPVPHAFAKAHSMRHATQKPQEHFVLLRQPCLQEAIAPLMMASSVVESTYINDCCSSFHFKATMHPVHVHSTDIGHRHMAVLVVCQTS